MTLSHIVAGGLLTLLGGCSGPCAPSPDVVAVLAGSGRPFTDAKQLIVELVTNGGAPGEYRLPLLKPLVPGGTVLLEPMPAPPGPSYVLDVTITSGVSNDEPLGRGVAHVEAIASVCNRVTVTLDPINELDLAAGDLTPASD